MLRLAIQVNLGASATTVSASSTLNQMIQQEATHASVGMATKATLMCNMDAKILTSVQVKASTPALASASI